MTGLYLVKFQVFTVNSIEGFCNRVCNGICLQLQNMTDLYLEKVQAFTINNYKYSHHELKKNPCLESNFEISGGSKLLILKSKKNKYN